MWGVVAVETDILGERTAEAVPETDPFRGDGGDPLNECGDGVVG